MLILLCLGPADSDGAVGRLQSSHDNPVNDAICYTCYTLVSDIDRPRGDSASSMRMHAITYNRNFDQDSAAVANCNVETR